MICRHEHTVTFQCWLVGLCWAWSLPQLLLCSQQLLEGKFLVIFSSTSYQIFTSKKSLLEVFFSSSQWKFRGIRGFWMALKHRVPKRDFLHGKIGSKYMTAVCLILDSGLQTKNLLWVWDEEFWGWLPLPSSLRGRWALLLSWFPEDPSQPDSHTLPGFWHHPCRLWWSFISFISLLLQIIRAMLTNPLIIAL